MIKVQNAIAVMALTSAMGLNLAALAVHANAQATPNQAGLVIQSPDGKIVTRCIAFSEPEISGYELLRRSNIPLVVDIASGGSLCKIENTGCTYPTQNCFCECQNLNESCVYWQYFIQLGGVWKYSPMGMVGQKVINGSVNGWRYGAGSASSGGAAPPLLTIDQICHAAPTTTASVQQAGATLVTNSPIPTPSLKVMTVVPASTPTSLPVASATSLVTSSSGASATRTVAPSPTATPVAVSTEIVTSQPVTTQQQATDTSTPTPLPAPTTQPESATPTSYIAFGIIVVVLVGVLFVTRAGMGKPKQ